MNKVICKLTGREVIDHTDPLVEAGFLDLPKGKKFRFLMNFEQSPNETPANTYQISDSYWELIDEHTPVEYVSIELESDPDTQQDAPTLE